ncbi:hypothetical protein C8J57DRAFT_1259658 [Mycena rebaudengoi]|nr:hypothetical protein C8J57DRAFT_1259658 [Mycena rebaudengoi]
MAACKSIRELPKAAARTTCVLAAWGAPALVGNLLRDNPDARHAFPSFLGNKRGREEEDAPAPAKKRREEVEIQEGMALPVVFHHYLKELDLHDYYIPLSLFTSSNLELINSSAPLLATVKLNPGNGKDKALRVLDTASFEYNYGREEDLDHGQWQEAARNYAAFIAAVSGGDESDQYIRWDAHFGFFERTEDQQGNFAAILAADISLRKKYASMPFKFDVQLYRHSLDKEINLMGHHQVRDEITSLLGVPLPPTPLAPALNITPPVSSRGRGRTPNSRGGHGGGRGCRGGAPFPAGHGGEPTTAMCLICSENAPPTPSLTTPRSMPAPATTTSIRFDPS